ncbi:MAG TPA: hypothetical protein VFO57_06590 [Burkholderiales bacterium]|nr:hypothetical protein [Burkholderiales bacterium]
MKAAMDGAGSRIEISKNGVTRALIAIVVALHMLNVPAVAFRYAWSWDGARHYIAFFGVSGEGKLPTFYSGVTLLACAMLLGLIAAHERSRGGFRSHWIGLGAIFALMAMDELVAIHELSSGQLRVLLGITGGPLYHAWVVPAMAFLAFLAIAYFRFLVALPARSRALFVTAGVIYVGGALGMEMAGAAYTAAHGQDLAYGVLSTIEEVLEMSGIVMFLYGLMDHLERCAPESRIRIVT